MQKEKLRLGIYLTGISMIIVLLASLIDIRYYFSHFYTYFNDTLLLTKLLFSSDISMFYTMLNVKASKIIFLLNIPATILFGKDHSIFFITMRLFNATLLIWLFFALSRIISPKKSFYFCLFIISQMFFLELLFSWYSDLSFFFISAIIMAYLYRHLFLKEKVTLQLISAVFLAFLIKNAAYISIPFFYLIFSAYHLIKSKDKKEFLNVFFLGLKLAFGFLLFFALILNLDISNVIKEVSINSVLPAMSQGNPLFSYSALSAFAKPAEIDYGILFLPKLFPYHLLIVMHLGLAYLLLKSKEKLLLYLFIMCGIFNLLAYNFLYERADELRYFLPVYPIYLFIIYMTLTSAAEKIDKKRSEWLIAIAIITLAIFNIMNSNLCIYSSTPVYPEPDLEIDPGSIVHINITEDTELYYHYFSELDSKVLEAYDIAFMKISPIRENATYILSSDPYTPKGYHTIREYDNIAAQSKIYLSAKTEN
ncbi:MAG: hypothetical protein NDI94_06195 [Candidatus Woesearchaeota archaeon]|nr:hypothetical protein [Candidatus Woesearchaeota archaeon]